MKTCRELDEIRRLLECMKSAKYVYIFRNEMMCVQSLWHSLQVYVMATVQFSK